MKEGDILELSAVLSLLQNAMRATMELYGDSMEYPPVHAQVALGSEDLTVKVNLQDSSLIHSHSLSHSLPVRTAGMDMKIYSVDCRI